MSLVIRTPSNPKNVTSAVRQVVAGIDRQQPVYDVMTLERYCSGSVSDQRLTVYLLAAFAGLALILAAVGIYGVISYFVSQRTHEIGIRMALGADRHGVLIMVIGQGLKLALIGVAIGVAGALSVTRLLASLLFGVNPRDPWTLLFVSAVLVGVALLACYIPARRAAEVDPMVALRHE
jgi:putative ABC transport system permease protein